MNATFIKRAGTLFVACCLSITLSHPAFAVDEGEGGQPGTPAPSGTAIGADQLAACNARVEAAKLDPEIAHLIDKIKGWCDLSQRPDLRGLPRVGCCPPSDPGCENTNTCQSYDQARHKICVCQRSSCNITDTALKEHLWEEYWHSLQNCLKNVANQNDNPFPLPVIIPEDLTVVINGLTVRCTSANTGRYGLTDWCFEINAKCNNPNDQSPMTIDDCNEVCDAYSNSPQSKACCNAFCTQRFNDCCNYFKPPVPTAPTPTPTPTPSPTRTPTPTPTPGG